VRLADVYVDRVNRFALEVDADSGRTFVSIPVRNSKVEYSGGKAASAHRAQARKTGESGQGGGLLCR